MADSAHLDIVRQGPRQWNLWRRECPGILTPDLRNADLQGAMLRGINLKAALLSNANLHRANLRGGADLSGADLTETNLRIADLSGANLFSANLRSADLRWTNLSHTKMDQADLAGSRVGQTIFADIDLRGVLSLDKIRHDGPSTIGVNTLTQSRGRIAEAFLRGTGVPDNIIVFANSLTTKPVEFYSCFISYSTRDQQFADRIYADLQRAGVRCWFAPHSAELGRKLHEQIHEAIRIHEKVLLILSASSMRSEWVKTEIAKARKREVEEGLQVLFPIGLAPFETIRQWECFDSDTGKDSAREVREYLIGDFSNWQVPDAYQRELTRLIRDLKPRHSSRTPTTR
jgi:uncharacterized protein YjbI with pentapeptide repeats